MKEFTFIDSMAVLLVVVLIFVLIGFYRDYRKNKKTQAKSINISSNSTIRNSDSFHRPKHVSHSGTHNKGVAHSVFSDSSASSYHNSSNDCGGGGSDGGGASCD